MIGGVKGLFAMVRALCLTFMIGFFLLALGNPAQAVRPRADRLAGPVHGEVLDVLDGDTLSVRVHVWIGQDLITDVRIAGIDTPELRGRCEDEKEKAKEARAAVQRLLADKKVVLSNIGLEKYAGRVLATVSTPRGVKVGDYLITSGLARPYGGEKRMGWCDSASR